MDILLRAVGHLAERGDIVNLVVAGRGDAEVALKRLRDELRIADQVTFAGYVTDDQKRKLMRCSWIHVLTSPNEGWGITNVEAAACGTPTVASDSPGLRESVLDGETGLLVPHGDVPALADSIWRLISDDGLRGRMAVNARRFAESLSWDVASEAVERFLVSVVREKNGQ